MTIWLSKTTLQKLLDLSGLHYTTSERSGPSLHSMQHNFLCRPCYFKTGLLQCSSGWTSIKHNQTSTNDSERSGMTGLQRAQKSPCYTSLYLPALAPGRSSHQVQDTDAAPSYFHSLITIHIPSRSLRSANERRLVVSSQRGTKSLSRTFSFIIPGWWNELPSLIPNAESLTIFKRHLKTHLFCHHLTWRTKTPSLS